MRLSRSSWILAASLLLAGCAGPGLRKDVFPPRASIQQLALQADGGWKLQLRLQNYSGVSMTFTRIDVKIDVAGNPAGDVTIAPALRVGPESADIAEASLKPMAAAALAVEALHGNGSVHYRLTGRIVTTEPSGDHPYSFEGVLSPVPGLAGVLR